MFDLLPSEISGNCTFKEDGDRDAKGVIALTEG